jgi:hypothetical protein
MLRRSPGELRSFRPPRVKCFGLPGVRCNHRSSPGFFSSRATCISGVHRRVSPECLSGRRTRFAGASPIPCHDARRSSLGRREGVGDQRNDDRQHHEPVSNADERRRGRPSCIPAATARMKLTEREVKSLAPIERQTRPPWTCLIILGFPNRPGSFLAAIWRACWSSDRSHGGASVRPPNSTTFESMI